jgi:hypothetical protein
MPPAVRLGAARRRPFGRSGNSASDAVPGFRENAFHADPDNMRIRSAVGIVAVLGVLATMIAVLLGSSPAGKTLDPVAQAADATTHAGGAQMSITGSVSLTGAAPITFSGGGDFNFSAGEGRVTLSMAGLPASVEAALHDESLTMTELFKAGSIYIASPLFASKLPGGAGWMKFDIARVGQAMGLDPSSVMSGGVNPANYLNYLKDAGSAVSVVGHDTVRGASTTHYATTIDLVKVAESQPGANRPQIRAALQKVLAEMGASTVPVDVWIDRHDLVRRIEMAMGVGSGGQRAQMSFRAEYFNFGATPSVDVPSAGEVFDITQQSLAYRHG